MMVKAIDLPVFLVLMVTGINPPAQHPSIPMFQHSITSACQKVSTPGHLGTWAPRTSAGLLKMTIAEWQDGTMAPWQPGTVAL